MEDVTVVAVTTVNPTESIEKVKRAMENLLIGLDVEVVRLRTSMLLRGKARGKESLARIRSFLRAKKILDAARAELSRGIVGNRIIFYLNKQAAYAGKVSFSEPEGESPLGCIKIEIRCKDPARLVDWLSPRSKEAIRTIEARRGR